MNVVTTAHRALVHDCFEVSESYRSLFLMSGTATLAALVPLAFAPSPEPPQRAPPSPDSASR